MFDIDHLYLQRLNFKVGENGEVIQDAYNQNDKEFYQKCCEDCKTVFAQNQGALDYVINELKEIV